MKKILIIHQSAELYGSDRMLLELLKKIDRNLFSVHVVLPNDGPLKNGLEKLDVKIYILPVLKLYRAIFKPKNLFNFFKELFHSTKELKKIHQTEQFDIVYSNTLAVLLGAFFSKKTKVKHIWHIHEIIEHPKLIAWLFPKLLYLFSNKIIYNSNATKENIEVREKKNIKKGVVVYNGLEKKAVTSAAKKTDFGFHEKDIIITLIGRISRLKGHMWTLKTFNQYFKDKENCKLIFVGSPVPNQEFYLQEVEAYIQENNLENQVKIFPYTKDLIDYWTITEVALMPSTEKESFGLVALEAMLQKKPVIGANHGGLKEVIKHNETGLLVEPNNEIELKKALEILIENENLRKEYGENGYQRATTFFSVNEYVHNIEKVILSV